MSNSIGPLGLSPWTYLAIGIFLEVVGTTCLKLSNGFTLPVPATLSVLCFLIALYTLSISVLAIPIGVVYAIWSGAGIVLITIIGALYFGELLAPIKLAFIAIILVGVVGLQIVSSEPGTPATPDQHQGNS
ncbi:MAG: multidrug efflux SMR transporter [Pseudomonadota bacterium]